MIRTGSVRLSDLAISRTAIYEAMRYGETVPDEYICGLVEEVISELEEVLEPSYMFDIVPAQLLDSLHVRIGGVEFNSGSIICSYMDGMTDACIFVATVGEAFEKYRTDVHATGDIVKDFVVDAVGSVIAESCGAVIEKRLAEESSLNRTMPCSPGYCGWNIKGQKDFFTLFPENPCGIRLSDSCLMYPEKSISGFYGLGETLVPQPYRCAVCVNKSCYKNRNK